ncbi:MAG: phosphoadenosine phosphosulfate reductase family protein [Bacteroides sp.]|nr:phosphoadenosine phosphosulfate reductase family protein [Bacteroides sp.]
MPKIEWDSKTGGVLLKRHITKSTLSVSPRPVFFEELNLLHLKEKGWCYPECKEPLLWACNKVYYYRGEPVFEVKGANVYDEPTVFFFEGKEKMRLKPVDMEGMLQRNQDEMFLIESEAIEFIRDTYLMYSSAKKIANSSKAQDMDFEALAARVAKKTKQKMAIVKEDCDSFDVMPLEKAEAEGKRVYQTTRIDRFLASFSGGKDSQVVLDLCTRAIPPENFEVIYSDTGYELPPSLHMYDEIIEHYQRLYPRLKFSIARNHASVLSYWDKIGTPSDTHRWCCAVMKTAPLYRMLKTEDNKQAKVLTFDGVRAEESTRRSGYNRIGKGVKHDTVINARPILFWNSTEIFLYLFKYNLQINPAYRQGMTRVGCLVCPFANEWNEMVANIHYKKDVKPFLDKIEKFAEKAGVRDIKEYVSEGGWKRRASGNLIEQSSFIEFKSTTPNFIAIIKNPKVHVLSFLQTLGNFSISKNGCIINGEIKIKTEIYKFKLIQERDKFTFEVKNVLDVILVGLFKRILFKSTYCINCETCEVECPTGALKVYPYIEVDKNKCVQCHKCLDFHEKGCIAANSLYITTGNSMAKKVGNIDRYKNFGLREEWLNSYLLDTDDYWTSNHGLNENYQIPSLKAWLRDAEIIDEKNNVTEIGKLIADPEITANYPNLAWEIVWINLSYNSFIVNWFIQNVTPDMLNSQKSLEEMIREQYPAYKEKTVHNAVYQLRRTLKESPIGGVLEQYNEIDKDIFNRNSFEDLSKEAIAYSIYKYASKKQIIHLRVFDLFKPDATGGVHKEFCISKSTFEDNLRTLDAESTHVLTAELNMGLDSITLRDDLTPLTVLKSLLRK